MNPIEDTVQNLMIEAEIWKSVELRTTQKFSSAEGIPKKPGYFNTIREHYIELKSGSRLLEVEHFYDDDFVSKMSYYCDGSKNADVRYATESRTNQSFILIKNSFAKEGLSSRTDRPIPLFFQFIENDFLYKKIRSSTPLGESNFKKWTCDTYLFKNLKWPLQQNHVFYIDKKSSTPVKVVSYRDEQSRLNNVPLWEWRADDLADIDGHTVAADSQQFEFRAATTSYDAGSKVDETLKVPIFTRSFKVELLRYDSDFDRSTFWPVFQPGVRVLDGITNKSYITPGEPVSEAKIAMQPATNSAVQATQPQNPLSTGSYIALSMSVLLMAAIIIYKMKRQAKH